MPTGSQAKVRFGRFNGVAAAFKRSRHCDRSLELEAMVLQLIDTKCRLPYFARLLNATPDCIVTKRIWGKLLTRIAHLMPKEVTNAVILIALAAMEQLYRTTGVVHNDLHSSNVLVVKTKKRTATFWFDEKRYDFDTYGHLPVIIDFGYAHVPGHNLASHVNSDIGYTIECADTLADARLLLTSTFQRPPQIFRPLHLNRDGWIKNVFESVYNWLYVVAERYGAGSCPIDTKLTIAVSRIDTLLKPVAYCCDNCMLYYEPAKVDDNPGDEFGDEFEFCPCFCRARQALQKFLKLREPVAAKVDCSEVSKAIEPYVISVLESNRKLKQELYAKLSVKTTLDVIRVLKPERCFYSAVLLYEKP